LDSTSCQISFLQQYPARSSTACETRACMIWDSFWYQLLTYSALILWFANAPQKSKSRTGLRGSRVCSSTKLRSPGSTERIFQLIEELMLRSLSTRV
jgi:hypothetical protein